MSTVESLHTPAAAATPDSALPPGLSRRTFLAVTAAASGGLAVALAVGGSTPATAAPLPSGSAVRAAPVTDLAVAALPVVYGTPTDIARTRAGWWWTRDADGTVVVFDRELGRWRATERQDWAGLVTAGSAILARWGRPSGRRELVLVSGADPDDGPIPPTSPTSPTTPAPPTGSSTSPTDPSTPSSSTTPTAPSGPTATTTAVAPTSPGNAQRAGTDTTAHVSGALSDTGYDPRGPLAFGLAALAAGGGLLVAARERGRRDPARRAAVDREESPPPPQ